MVVFVSEQLRSRITMSIEVDHAYRLSQLAGNRPHYRQTDTVIATR